VKTKIRNLKAFDFPGCHNIHHVRHVCAIVVMGELTAEVSIVIVGARCLRDGLTGGIEYGGSCANSFLISYLDGF
jgi:hypothetical protein